ncbi:substrate binding domain-containing protein [Pseudomonas sp. UL073]|uniref:Substrate binding domain-containing protein n=1 Tax=Zestomonas insulae TaxID=2809017 RepID=A0ABS2IFQ7_9GAMM|nr:substrate binding domain-containing protein [Pseudomonas insulae]
MDVAIRTREHEPSSGIAMRPLAETRRIFCASPGYLARRGRPKTPVDLKQHDMMVYTLANNPYELHLERGGESQSVQLNSIFDCDDGQVLRRAALAGLGILILPMYIVFDDVVAGRLVPVLDDWELPSLTINIAYQSRHHLPMKVRVFIDFLVERFEQLDFKRKWSSVL